MMEQRETWKGGRGEKVRVWVYVCECVCVCGAVLNFYRK